MPEIKCPKLLPPCYTMCGRWYDIEHRCYVDPPEQPVYVRIGGRRREAVRWLWLWRIVALIQRYYGHVKAWREYRRS